MSSIVDKERCLNQYDATKPTRLVRDQTDPVLVVLDDRILAVHIRIVAADFDRYSTKEEFVLHH
jgi:hypothetical protein